MDKQQQFREIKSVSNYLIPARGLKLYSAIITVFSIVVSNYLIPARGLKQENKELDQDNSLGFQLPNPRKGTET